MRRVAVLQMLLAGFLAAEAGAQQLPMAVARLVDRQGQEVGVVQLQEVPGRGVMLRLEVNGLLQGSHGIQIHPVGRCDDAFEGSGVRGARSANLTTGDLGTLTVPRPGRIEIEKLARRVTLMEGAPNSLLDSDGSAVLIFGDDGAPAVCGVIQR